jgi:hypothetical protein
MEELLANEFFVVFLVACYMVAVMMRERMQAHEELKLSGGVFPPRLYPPFCRLPHSGGGSRTVAGST